MVIGPTGADGFKNDNGGLWQVNDLKIQTTTSGHGLYALNFGAIYFQNLVFGTVPSSFHLFSQANATLKATGNYAVAGNASYLAAATGWIILSSRTISYSNNPAFANANFLAHRGGVLECYGMSFVNGATVT